MKRYYFHVSLIALSFAACCKGLPPVDESVLKKPCTYCAENKNAKCISGSCNNGQSEMYIYDKVDPNKLEEKCSGNFVNGHLTGNGFLYDYCKGKEILYFQGYFKNGRACGKGILYKKCSDKIFFEGNFEYDIVHGEGTIYFYNPDFHYTGLWINHKREGNHYDLIYKGNGNKEYCKSNYKNGLREGLGVKGDGSSFYIGEFIKDKPHGNGTFYEITSGKPNKIYEGQYVNGEKQGYGIEYITINGITNKNYEGEWFNGLRHGKGVEYCLSNKVCFEGNYKNGSKYGFGKSYESDGLIWHIGNYEDNSPNGSGITYHKNGKIKYEGNFKDGERHGMGKYYNINGELIYSGEFYKGLRYRNENEKILLTKNVIRGKKEHSDKNDCDLLVDESMIIFSNTSGDCKKAIMRYWKTFKNVDRDIAIGMCKDDKKFIEAVSDVKGEWLFSNDCHELFDIKMKEFILLFKHLK